MNVRFDSPFSKWLLILAFVGFVHAGPADDTKNRIKIRKKTRLQRTTANESQEFNAEKMALLAQKRRSLVLDIKKFIRDARDGEQAAELNMRLGSLYMEDYTYFVAMAQDRFEKESQAFKAGKRKRAPKFDNSEALAALDRTRAIYRDLIQKYPKNPRRDEMLYFFAVASLDRSQIKDAMSSLTKLIQELPNSKYASDALVQLGDYYFDANDFKSAEVYYDKLIAKKYKPLMAYAVYKKGWCEYNKQKYQESLAHFKWVIQNEDNEDTGAPIRVRNEALRDITLPFVDLKLLEDGIAFFRSFGEPHYRQGLETMASLYYEQGNYKNSIRLYDILVKMDAKHPKNPGYDINLIESLKLSHQDGLAIQRLFARLPIYLKGSNWYEINSANAQVVQDAFNQFEETARKYAFQYHAEGQKTKNDELYNSAKALYAKYIQYFPNTTHTAKVRFYLAEILYKQKFFVTAADHYYIVYKDPNAGELKDEAIRYALSALDQQLNIERRKAGLQELNNKLTTKLKAKEEESLELLAYSPVEAKFIDIATEYLAKYPKAKDSGDVLYEQSYLMYSHHDLLRAYRGFWTLVQNYPKHATSMSSAFLILDILNRKKDYPKLILACHKFLQTKEFKQDSFRKDVADILRKSELKRVQILEEKNEFKDAADGYLAYTQTYGGQDEALFEKALYNAAVNYTKGRFYLNAVETQEKFLRRFPNSPLRENLLLQVAKTFETLANFEKAAFYFDQFAIQYPKNPQVPNALRLAGLYYWGSGNVQKAESLMVKQVKASSKDSQAIERDLLDLYQSQGSTDKEIQLLLAARAVKGVSFAQYLADTVRIAELAATKTGKFPPSLLQEGIQIVQKHGKEVAQSPKGVEAMAKLMTLAAAQREGYFYSLRLALPQSKLEANLQKKLALMKEIEKENGRIAALGNPEWGLGAIYRTAAAYKNLAEAITSAPVPPELSAEQLEMYRAEIQRQMIKPFKEKSRNLAASCLDKAQEYNVLSVWNSRCYELAGSLEPERYPLARTFYLPALRTALMIPDQATAAVPMGSIKNYAYPFYVPALFEPERQPASGTGADLPSLYEIGQSSADARSVSPRVLTYQALDAKRKEILKSSYASEKPDDIRKGASFGFLNVLRVMNPQQGQQQILRAIQREPNNEALHNLLGLAYFDGGNIPAARVTWLAMLARGIRNAAIWNNLGVLSVSENKEAQAIEYFTEGAKLENAKEAWINLGFIALKYRNGVEAKRNLERALKVADDDASVQVALVTARLQNRELDNAKEGMIDLVKKFRSDPYARLAMSYFLIDVEKDSALAAKMLAEYINSQSLENDNLFRQALQEARRIASSEGAAAGGELPGIE